jgi:hypothetical protein
VAGPANKALIVLPSIITFAVALKKPKGDPLARILRQLRHVMLKRTNRRDARSPITLKRPPTTCRESTTRRRGSRRRI